MYFQFEVNRTGGHRLVNPDGEAGPWAPYAGFARVRWRGDEYLAVTRYFEGNLPPERAFVVAKTDVPTKKVVKE